MFNVYKNQQSRQTGSRNPMGSKTLPTIWGTYMTLVTKYQIFAINSCWEKCDEKCAYISFFVAFFSATIDGRDLIFGHKLHIGTPYRGKRFLTRQIPTSCLSMIPLCHSLPILVHLYLGQTIINHIINLQYINILIYFKQ
jgi:hypothetical protein